MIILLKQVHQNHLNWLIIFPAAKLNCYHFSRIFHAVKTEYSLYSTATQNYSCWILALAKTPIRRFCVTYTNILVSKKLCGPNATPNASQ